MIELKIKKKFRDFDLDIDIKTDKKVLGLLGRSGCGKSVTLKMVAGLIKPDSGKIVVDKKVFFDSENKINLSPKDRNIGFMFQNSALFPHLTILENVMISMGKRDKKIAEELLDRFHVLELKDKYPNKISGGQRQRAALARMMSINPRMILLDEPFSSLDSNTSFKSEMEVSSFLKETGLSTIFVSHNRNEAYRMTNEIAVIENGKVVDFGPKDVLMKNPKTVGSAILLGYKNILEKNGSKIILNERNFSKIKSENSLEIIGIVKSVLEDLEKYTIILETENEKIYVEKSISEEFLNFHQFSIGKEVTLYYPIDKIIKLEA